MSPVAEALRTASLYRGLSEEDRQRLAEVALLRTWDKGEAVFNEGDPSDFLTGTTIETCIRLMSRWGKEGVIETEKEGFLLIDRTALEKLTLG